MSQIDRLVALIAARQHGAFSTTQLPAISDAEVNTRSATARWKALQQNIFVIGGSPDTWERRLWVALLVGGEGSVVGARSAIALHHVRGAVRGPIDVLQPEASVPNVKIRTSRRTTFLPSWQVTEVDGFPVVTVERALFDLAGLTSRRRRLNGWVHLSEKRVERLVDNAISQKLVTVHSLTRVHLSLAGRGRPGSRLMRELLEVRSDGYVPTDSDLEDLFVKLVADHGLPPPRRQVALGSADERIGQVDFYYDSAKLVVEADSRAFHGQRSQMVHDHQRELQLLAQGWQVLHVDWWQLKNDGPEVARHLRRILEQRPHP